MNNIIYMYNESLFAHILYFEPFWTQGWAAIDKVLSHKCYGPSAVVSNGAVAPPCGLSLTLHSELTA